MAPYPIAPPPEEEALIEVVEELKEQESARPPLAPTPPGRTHVIFTDSLLELSSTRPRQRTLDFVVSIVVHSFLLGTLILLPLYFTEALDLKQFTQTLLVAPPPPPPPPPPAAPAVLKTVAPRRVFISEGRLLAPTAIPQQVAMLKEEQLPPDVEAGVVGGVPGGVPGGQAGGVIGGIISNAPRTFIPMAPTMAAPKAPIRVGGRIKPPRVISQPEPAYPLIAKQAKIQGVVVIDAVIDPAGNVVEMQVVSGHPLLIPAALEALRHWKYEPTYLNDQPVAIQLLVTINFRLN